MTFENILSTPLMLSAIRNASRSEMEEYILSHQSLAFACLVDVCRLYPQWENEFELTLADMTRNISNAQLVSLDESALRFLRKYDSTGEVAAYLSCEEKYEYVRDALCTGKLSLENI